MRRSFLLLLAAVPFSAFAQSSPNYDCDHAVPVPVAASNIQAAFVAQDARYLPSTVVPAATCSPANFLYDGWFSFVATAATHWIRTDADTWIDRSVEAFSGSCGALTSIACAAPGDAALQLNNLTPGTTYFFRTLCPMPGFGEDGITAVAVVSVPANNDCANARLLNVKSGNGGIAPGTETSTLGATQSSPGCSVPAASNDDVWYRFTAVESKHWLTEELGGSFPLTTEWYSGVCGNLTSIACSTAVASGLVPGQQYYIRQYTTSVVADETVRGYIDLYSAAANDECAGAIAMTVAEGTDAPQPVDLSLLACGSSTVPCGTIARDVWVSFVAPTTEVYTHHKALVAAALYSGTCGALVCEVTESSDYAHAFTDLAPGTTYYLKLGRSGAQGAFTLYLRAAPAYDDCIDAVPLDVQSGDLPQTWTHGSTYGATQSLPGCSSPGDSNDDVWYRFTATSTSLRAYATFFGPIGGNPYYNMELHGGTCSALTNLVCSGIIANDEVSLGLPGLTIGAEYFLRIYYNGPVGGMPFRIALTEGVVNDECAGALELLPSTLDDFNDANKVVNTRATNGAISCDAFTRDLWYRFTATGPRAVFVGAPGEITTELYSGTCGNLTNLSCLADVERAGFSGLVAGQEYHLRVAAAAHVFIPLLFTTPPNDEIAGAPLLPANDATFASSPHEGWTYGASQSISVLCGTVGTPDDDVWYRFVATSTTHTIRVVEGNLRYQEGLGIPLSFRIEAYDTLTTDSAGLAQSVLGCGDGVLNLTGLTVGDTILFRVFSWDNGPQSVNTFMVRVSSSNNDETTGALALPYADDYSATFNTTGATQSMTGADCAVDDFADDDIWFKFTHNGQPARVIVALHDKDLTLEVFSGTPGNLTSVACSDNILVLPDNLVNGQTYYVRLYSWANALAVQGRIGLFPTPDQLTNTCVDLTCLGPVLLQNPSIEQGAYCAPVQPTGGDLTLGTSLAPGWYDYHSGTADSYSSCANVLSRTEAPAQEINTTNQYWTRPRTGKGMAGIYAQDNISEYREYLDAPLTAPLVVGEPYLVSFHVAGTALSSLFFATDGMGALFTEGPDVYNSTDNTPRAPQIISYELISSRDWVNVCGVFVPDKPYDHVTIGNFLSQSEHLIDGLTLAPSRSYYYVDDVVVALVTDPGCITNIGDVPLLDESASGVGDALRVYPNPASERLNIVADASLFGQRAVIEVFDATGSRVHAEQVNYFSALQPLDLSQDWKEGLYLVMVRVEGQAPQAARVVVKR
ncbi:MAG: T9SS type A sorting domain-containing protein [Flavobacteriales bacterium]|nr:T9SS type A sorting domain-containing protein [Flavobacteriales bacterium]